MATTTAISFAFPDCLELVDWSGRAQRAVQAGAIPGDTPPILQRLSPEVWLQTLRGFKHRFHTVIGPPDQLQARARRLNQRWLCRLGGARLLYPTVA